MHCSTKLLMAILFNIGVLAGLNTAVAQSSQNRDDIMRPTEHGIRLTPEMARAGASLYVEQDLQKKLDLMPNQRKKMTESIARRAMNVGHTKGAALQNFTEYFFQAMCKQEMWRNDWPADQAQEFAQQVKPLLPEYRNFLHNILEDSRAVLNEQQLAKFSEEINEAETELEEFKTRMDRWAEGDVREGEHPFETPSEPDENAEPKQPKTEEEKRRERILRHARWRVNRVSYEYGPRGWRHFMGLTALHYNFDEQQIGQAEKILEDYKSRYEEIANDQWEETLRKNRIKKHLGTVLDDIPDGPWRYHLDRAYEQLIEPVKELDAAYRREILAIATPEQRGAAMDELRQEASKHGLRFSRWDMTALQLAAD
jgi:DNA-binding ferritin-like protein